MGYQGTISPEDSLQLEEHTDPVNDALVRCSQFGKHLRNLACTSMKRGRSAVFRAASFCTISYQYNQVEESSNQHCWMLHAYIDNEAVSESSTNAKDLGSAEAMHDASNITPGRQCA